jgi:hypothetical protein
LIGEAQRSWWHPPAGAVKGACGVSCGESLRLPLTASSGGASGAGRPLRGDGIEPPRLEGQEARSRSSAEATSEAEEPAAEAPTRAGAGGCAGRRVVQLRGAGGDGLPSLWTSVPGLLLRGRVAGYGGTTAGGPPGGGPGRGWRPLGLSTGKGGAGGDPPGCARSQCLDELDQAANVGRRSASTFTSCLVA